MSKLYPLLMRPAFRPMVWGGDKLKELFGKPLPSGSIGESWEVACREDLWSVVGNGFLKGTPLPEVFQKYSTEILGQEGSKFPWLVKLIDAKTDLSVQVHPDDEYAVSHGDFSGKTEMWHILQADPGSRLVVGFRQNVTRQIVEQKASDGSILEILNEVEVKQGDTFFIPPGTVHAIGGGIVLLEIQQNSDATYRLYDWGRMGTDGKPRELHIQKAADVVNLQKSSPQADSVKMLDNGDQLLANCDFFSVKKRNVTVESMVEGFAVLISLEGKVKVGTLSLNAGDSVLIPHSVGKVPISGSGEIVLVEKPD